MLIELATGGLDRITEAALFALVTCAWVDPSARPEVAALVGDRLRAADQAHHPIAWSVAQLALATPDLAPEQRENARAVARAEEEYVVPRIPRQRRGGRLRRWLAERLIR
jgi:hypothetical protein